MSFRVPRGWARKRAYVLARDGYVCWLCQQAGADSVDHVVPRAEGGGHSLDNLRAAHHRCNASKGKRAVLPMPTIDRRWG